MCVFSLSSHVFFLFDACIILPVNQIIFIQIHKETKNSYRENQLLRKFDTFSYKLQEKNCTG